MTNDKGREREALWAQRIWTVVAAAAAGIAVVVTPLVAPVAGAAPVPAGAPAAQPIAAPAVVEEPGTVGPSERKDRRARTTGMTVAADGNLYLWGWGICGADGTEKRYASDPGCEDHYVRMFAGTMPADSRAPYTVEGLPEGAIEEMTAQKYNFNALDVEGYVWGWGSITNVDGTGGSNNPWSANDHPRNNSTETAVKFGEDHGSSFPPKRIRIGTAWDLSCREVGSSTIKVNCGPVVGSDRDDLKRRGEYLGQNDPVTMLSSTEFAGAAVTKSGRIYSWGGRNWGGVAEGAETEAGHEWGENRYGAVEVRFQGLAGPDPNNKPVQILGGYQTFWILMENGEVWYFGGNNMSGNLGWDSEYERPVKDTAECAGVNYAWSNAEETCHDQPVTFSGRKYNDPPDDGEPQIAVKSKALSEWFRTNNKDEFIVQVHSGTAFGAALLSTGRVLTWGSTKSNIYYQAGAIGRRCAGDGAAQELCAHSPRDLDFGGLSARPHIVKMSCQYTGAAALDDKGNLYGWGGRHTSWENYPDRWKGWYGQSSATAGRWDKDLLAGSTGVSHENFTGRFVSGFVGGGAVIRVATRVRDFQDGQGYTGGWDQDGKQWGRGWNRVGAVGHTGTNWGFGNLDNRARDETRTRWVWFSEPQYEDCFVEETSGWENLDLTDEAAEEIIFNSKEVTYKGNNRKYNCADLNAKNASDQWLHRFTLEQCLEGKCKGPSS
ncbi:MAG: hypothetical protein LBG11_08825 [Bifidobacteriaceae bacterium]|jgi:alpha-tubulin suppressor-like RCC1 family protein|nr:hypothetical protein [Bifidobacteriaceae bacterium]